MLRAEVGLFAVGDCPNALDGVAITFLDSKTRVSSVRAALNDSCGCPVYVRRKTPFFLCGQVGDHSIFDLPDFKLQKVEYPEFEPLPWPIFEGDYPV